MKKFKALSARGRTSIHRTSDKAVSRKPPIAPVLVVYPSRPERSGPSLHRTGMMVMIHRLRGWTPDT